MSDKKLHFPSQQSEFTGYPYRNRWRRNVDYGKALEQWKAMNDAENERRAAMRIGTQPINTKAINQYHEQQLEP